MENEKEVTELKTKDIEISKNVIKEVEVSIKKSPNVDKRDNSVNGSNSNTFPSKTRSSIKKKLKVTFEKKVEIIKVESYKKYNLENAFDEPLGGNREDRGEQYHCKCFIF